MKYVLAVLIAFIGMTLGALSAPTLPPGSLPKIARRGQDDSGQSQLAV